MKTETTNLSAVDALTQLLDDPLVQNHQDPIALRQSPVWKQTAPLTEEMCREKFDSAPSFTIGVEEEMMLLDPETLDLSPSIEEVLALVRYDERFSRELRPAQIELITPVCPTAWDAWHELRSARQTLIEALDGQLRIASAGTHPLSKRWGEITDAERYRQIADEYTWVAARSVICGLHVHIAVPGADRALAVYNALRSYLPELAAISANSPFVEGYDTAMASIRPKISQGFPRSGIPPRFGSWAEFLRFVNWGRDGGLFPDATHFWWDMRLHPIHGTIEIRVCDAQTHVLDSASIIGFIQALVGWLAARYDAGDRLPIFPGHVIVENAWRANRYGIHGWLVNLDSGEALTARERILQLLEWTSPYATYFDRHESIRDVRPLLLGNGADRQRYVAEREGLEGLTRWIADETERSAYESD
jgi:carboxylate-amine ligase